MTVVVTPVTFETLAATAFSECPVCGSGGINHVVRSRPDISKEYVHETDYVGIASQAAQGAIAVPMKGESCHCLFYVCIGQHKGDMMIWIEKTDKKVFVAGVTED